MAKEKIFFVTGTDTGVGKTLASCGMLAAARLAGYSTAALKPVAAGVMQTQKGLLNEDVISLSAQCTLSLAPEEINPVCLDEPIAPHIAAARAGMELSAERVAGQCRTVLDKQADLTVVEGAGGWLVPLGLNESMADIAMQMNVPVILVVGMRLGCLNHALLTAESIMARGLVLTGWIANAVEPAMPAFDENLETLRTRMPAPLLAELPWLGEEIMNGEDVAELAAQFIDTDALMTGNFH